MKNTSVFPFCVVLKAQHEKVTQEPCAEVSKFNILKCALGFLGVHHHILVQPIPLLSSCVIIYMFICSTLPSCKNQEYSSIVFLKLQWIEYFLEIIKLSCISLQRCKKRQALQACLCYFFLPSCANFWAVYAPNLLNLSIQRRISPVQ